MTEYYLNGSAATNGDGSYATPWNSVASAISGSVSGDTIYVYGTFDEADATLTGKSGQIWIGVNDPIIKRTLGHVVTPVLNCGYYGIKFDGGDQANYNPFYLNDVAITGFGFYDCSFIRGNRVYIGKGQGAFRRCKFYGNLAKTAITELWTCELATVLFDECIFGGQRWPVTQKASGLRIYSGDVRIYNSLFAGIQLSPIVYNRDSVTRIDIINNVFAGYGTDLENDGYAIRGANTPGTIVENIGPNYYLGSGKAPTNIVSGPTVTLMGGKLGIKITDVSYFAVSIDDYMYVNRSYYTEMAAKAMELKVPVTQFLSTTATMTDDDWAFCNSIGNAYYKFGDHTSLHAPLTQANLPYLFSFTTYPANSTAEFDGATFTLTSDGSTIVYQQNVSNTVLSTVLTAINAISGFVVAKHASADNAMPGRVMATTAKTAISALTSNAIAIDYSDSSRYYEYMINDSRAKIIEKINPEYRVDALAYPYGYNDATLRTWLSQYSQYGVAFGINTRANSMCIRTGVDPYMIFRGSYTMFNASQEVEERNFRSFFYALSMSNGVSAFYGHNASEFPVTKIEMMKNLMDECAVSYVFPDEIETYLHTLYYDSGKYHGDYIDPSYKMTNDSSLVDAGAWISGVNDTGEADPWGNYVHRLPNIGADQGAGSPGSVAIVFNMEAS